MTGPAMKRSARVAFGGAIHDAVEHPGGVQLTDGRVLPETAVVWLPPFEVGTIIALGINYADHAKELAKELTMSAKDEPLAFLKAPNSLMGHRGFTRRPSDATFHFAGSDAELAVLLASLVAAGLPVVFFGEVRESIEDVYMRVSGHRVT